MGLDETQGLCRRKAFVQSQLILAVRRNIIVVFDAGKGRIGHAQFLPFIDERRTAQGKQDGRHGLGRLLLIRPFREIAVDTTYLVVVLKEDGIPAVSGRRLLAVGQGLLELGQGPRFGPAPDFIIGKFQIRMAELEEHTEGPVLADPAGQVGRRDAIGFGDGEDIVAVEDVAAKFVEKIEDARRIGNHLVDRRQAIGAVDRAVGQDGRFLDVDDGIDAEAADAFIDPEIGCIIEGLADGRIRPIQIGLFDGEGVQVILLPFFAPRPGRAAEDRAPVRRRRTVLFGIPPNVPVRLVVGAAAFRFLEPGMLV